MIFKRWHRVALWLPLAWLTQATAPVAEEPAPLVLVHADYNENTLSGGRLVSILNGNVHFSYDDAQIHSRNATWHRSDGIAQFLDSVSIIRPQQKLQCRRLDFSRDKKQVVMTGNVEFFDSEEQISIFAQKGIYHLDSRAVELEKEPRLMRFDTLANDTLHITGRRMVYDDSLKIATVFEDVKVTKGRLQATCKTAYYHPQTDRALLRSDPHILYDGHTLDGDSVDLVFVDDLLRGIMVRGRAHAVHNDFSDRDSVVTEIDGDSLYMQISSGGRIDTTWVYRNVRSSYYARSTPDQVNQASGKMMRLDFSLGGGADHLVINGNARSTYYIDDASGTGRNEASGDQIDLYFRDGRAVFITLTGAVRGMYFSRRQ